jgi:hypothetical protein
MKEKAEALAVHARIEEAQAALRRKLRKIDLEQLRQRPPSGEWSAMENVRHLVFAEQHHFSVLLPKGFRWGSAGVPPPSKEKGQRRLTPVGREPDATIDEVFDAWAKVHAVVLEFAREDERNVSAAYWTRVASGLAGNLNHVNIHIGAIERLLGVELKRG